MAATLIEGKALAAKVREQVAQEVAAFKAETGQTPGLAVMLVGDDPASQVYVRTKLRQAEALGIDARFHHLPADSDQRTVEQQIEAINADPAVHGILLQWPVPAGLDYRALIDRISPEKDVDGFHPINAGRLLAGEDGFVPCTPQGIMTMLDAYGIDVAGKHAVVIGRSLIVGKPMAALLLNANATVTIAHSRTVDLAEHTRRADILVVAVGRANMITAEHVKPGAAVIDVGINRLEDGSLTGDVDFASVEPVAGWLTPVPGGVGPMTVATLMQNTLKAARMQWNASKPSRN